MCRDALIGMARGCWNGRTCPAFLRQSSPNIGHNKSTTMQTHGHTEQTEFWSDVYRGRPIAILNHYGRLHVYLDHTLQHHVVFAERANALAWLMQRIDQGAPAGMNDRSREIVRVPDRSEALHAV